MTGCEPNTPPIEVAIKTPVIIALTMNITLLQSHVSRNPAARSFRVCTMISQTSQMSQLQTGCSRRCHRPKAWRKPVLIAWPTVSAGWPSSIATSASKRHFAAGKSFQSKRASSRRDEFLNASIKPKLLATWATPLPTRIASFNLVNLPPRVPRNDALVGTIDEQIKVLQHDGAKQCRLPLRFYDGGKCAVPAKQCDINALCSRPLGGAPVGVAHGDLFVPTAQTQFFHELSGQHELGGARIDNCPDRLPPNLIFWNCTTLRESDVVVISHFQINADSPHAIGSFRAHCPLLLPARTCRMSSPSIIARTATLNLSRRH